MTEVATMLTDYMLCALSVFFALKLSSKRGRAQEIWMWAFVTLALGSLFGGTYHGFKELFMQPLPEILKRLTLWSIFATSYYLSLFSLEAIFKRSPIHPMLNRALLFKAGLFAFGALVEPRFILAVLDYVPALALLTWAAARMPSKELRNAWLWGIGLSVVAALVQVLKIAPSEHFNHNDLYHVIQAAGLFAFYRAAKISEA
jgi:hypothetical protein